MKRYALLVVGLILVAQASHSQTFENVAEEAGIDFVPEAYAYMGGGCAWFDYDHDGWEDLYVTGCLLPDRLYKNNGDGTFSDVSLVAGLDVTGDRNTTAVISGDIDNDTDSDLLVTTWKFNDSPDFAPNFLLQNNGDGTFTDITATSGITSAALTMAAGFLDVNLDGYLDIYLGNYIEVVDFITEDGEVVGFNHTCFEDELYINNGDNTFTESAEAYGVNNPGCTLAVATTDYDRDGDPDLMVANDFGEFLTPNKLYRNDYPLPQFTDVSLLTGADLHMYGMGIAGGDYDEDGDHDYYVTNLGLNKFLQQESGTFTEIATDCGISNPGQNGLHNTSWGAVFFDYDNDTWLDLAVSDGHMPSADMVANNVWDPNALFRNNGDGTFENVAQAAGIADTNIARGMAVCDFDHNGFEDIAVVNIENDIFIGEENFLLYRNAGNEYHFLDILLTGVSSNTDAYGSLVTLYADGREFIREHTASTASHASQHGPRIHFGLGDIVNVDSVVVSWPGGWSEALEDPQIDQTHHVVQGFSIGVPEHNGLKISAYPIPAHNYVWVNGWQQRGRATWQLTSITGACVEQKAVAVGPEPFLVQFSQSPPPGYYNLLIHSDFYVAQIPLIIH
ncbi:MAG: CRTAC1 family protein [Flavobacteriales bacterium]|nr:CRTAC1 family protein [Flavobacteriales bacterium]